MTRSDPAFDGSEFRDARPPGDDQTRADAEQTAADTDQTATARVREDTVHHSGEIAALRDTTSLERDVLAGERDVAAAKRDHRAEALDHEIEKLERSRALGDTRARTGTDILLRAAEDRRRGAGDRQVAGRGRVAAGRDRKLAALDREQAALDREHSAHERAAAGLDDLTSTLRRGVGLLALQREMDRARRTDEPLVVAFVDVNGLKVINDRDGHIAGDSVLRHLADIMRTHLRLYDLIVRFGGDEFLCVISDAESGDVHRRFGSVNGDLVATVPPSSVTVGLAEYQPGESIAQLIDRADVNLLDARRNSDSAAGRAGRPLVETGPHAGGGGDGGVRSAWGAARAAGWMRGRSGP